MLLTDSSVQNITDYSINTNTTDSNSNVDKTDFNSYVTATDYNSDVDAIDVDTTDQNDNNETDPKFIVGKVLFTLSNIYFLVKNVRFKD